MSNERDPRCTDLGGRHHWDTTRLRCLDCGREAAEIADELDDWLGQTEDSVDRMADQIEAMRALLENWVERYGGIEYVPRTAFPTVWVCRSCGAETRAVEKGWQAGPPQPFPHTAFCKAEATRTLLAELEADA